MQYHAIPCNTMQYHAIPCNTMQYHAIPCNTKQYHAIPCNTMYYHAIPCNTMLYHAIPCNTMQYHLIPCNIINNCWRSVPLPCGQYIAIFVLIEMHLFVLQINLRTQKKMCWLCIFILIDRQISYQLIIPEIALLEPMTPATRIKCSNRSAVILGRCFGQYSSWDPTLLELLVVLFELGNGMALFMQSQI